jgi:hypothetical protein
VSAADVGEYVARLVSEAPSLTTEQVARLRALLTPEAALTPRHKCRSRHMLPPDSSEGRSADRPVALTDTDAFHGGPSEPERTSAYDRSA